MTMLAVALCEIGDVIAEDGSKTVRTERCFVSAKLAMVGMLLRLTVFLYHKFRFVPCVSIRTKT